MGFSDQAHLTRLFKRELGVTPGRYVRSRPR
ncbi:AraC family transcriptional regulator [Sorangium sp. So ce887]